MLDFKKLFSKETTVKISVVKIDNKKLSKSMFNQFNTLSPFDKLYNLKENVTIFGYVNDKSKFLIWSNGEGLYKYDLKNFSPLIRLNMDLDLIADLYKIYPSKNVETLYYGKAPNIYDEHQISSVLDKKDQYEIIGKIEMIKDFKLEVLDRQIFL